MKSKSARRFNGPLVALALTSNLTTLAKANDYLFFDGFSDTNSLYAWQGPLPDNYAGDPYTVHYLGFPSYSFQSLNGQAVLRLNNTLGNQSRVGCSSTESFNVPGFRYEVRFNTLVQSATTSIDNFIEVWILDAADAGRADFTLLLTPNWGSTRMWGFSSSIDNLQWAWENLQRVEFLDNTFYRLVLQGWPGQAIRASLHRDDGTEMAVHTFAHDPSTFTSGIKLGISQGMGMPGSVQPVDVAVDYAALMAAPLAAKVGISMSGTQVQITWPTGTLESAPAVTGSWATVTNAAAPSYRCAPEGQQKFYRVRQ